MWVCVYVCVCVCARARARVCLYVFVFVCVACQAPRKARDQCTNWSRLPVYMITMKNLSTLLRDLRLSFFNGCSSIFFCQI